MLVRGGYCYLLVQRVNSVIVCNNRIMSDAVVSGVSALFPYRTRTGGY